MTMLRLKEVRERKGLDQKEVAKQFGLSVSTISLYETGKREPALETVVKFANFFGVTTDYLLGRIVRDPYSDRFREHLGFELDKIDPADVEAYIENGGNYGRLEKFAEETYPLSLADACKIANEARFLLSDLMGEEESDYDSFVDKASPSVIRIQNEKVPPAEESAQGDALEETLLGYISQMTEKEKRVLLSAFESLLAQGSAPSASSPEAFAGTAQEAARPSFS